VSKTATVIVVISVASVAVLTAALVRIASAPNMAGAALNFLAALTPEQKARTVIPFADEERHNWHFIPRPRRGLPLKEMTMTQRHLAHALLSAGLSQRGFMKATTIMSLEEVLKVLENDSGERRDPEKYYFTVFGEPSEKGTWGYRVEGHHLSLNFTVSGGKVSGTPAFLGANPAEIRTGPRKGLRVLHREEDLARALMMALEPQQRDAALVSKTAYPDILTEASRKAALAGQPQGLSASKMTPKQREMLDELLAEYVYNAPDDMAERRLAQIREAGGNLHFAWAGVVERGGPHYYRIQAPSFLIEYDNTQNNANHIHSVWRDFKGDFGEDLLQQHYQRASRDKAHGHSHD
jgi:hypothetical protein